MTRQILYTPRAAKPPPTYSQAVKAGGLIFVSGTAPVGSVTGSIDGTTIQQQTARCLTNIQAILDDAGSSLDKLVSVTVVLADEDDFAGMNEEWLRWFPIDAHSHRTRSSRRDRTVVLRWIARARRPGPLVWRLANPVAASVAGQRLA